jgi:hypothetical protein
LISRALNIGLALWLLSRALRRRGISPSQVRSAPPQAPTPVEVGPASIAAIAEALSREITQDERRRLLTRALVVSGAAAVLVLILVPLLANRAPLYAALRAESAAAVEIVTVSGAVAGDVYEAESQLRVLAVAGTRSGEDAGVVDRTVLEVAVPVFRSECIRLAARIGADCGSGGKARAVGEGLTIEWSRNALLTLSARGVREANVTPTGSTTWALGVNARRLTLAFDCLAESRFKMIVPGRAVVEADAACNGAEPANLRFLLAFAPGGTPTVALSDIETLRLNATGREASMELRAGSMEVGGAITPIRTGQATLYAMRAEGARPISLSIDIARDQRREAIEVVTPEAASVLELTQERVPTEFTRHRDIWVAVLLTLATIVTVAWVEALTSRR